MASKAAKPSSSGGKRPLAKDSKDAKKGTTKTAASKGHTPEELQQKEQERTEKEQAQVEKERLEAEEEMKRQMSEEQLQAYEEQKAREKAEQERAEREAAEKKAAEIRIDINAKIVELQRNRFIADVYRVELEKILADNAEAARLQILAEEEAEAAADEAGGEEEEEEEGKEKEEKEEDVKESAEGAETKEEVPETTLSLLAKITVTPEPIVKEMTDRLRGYDEAGRQIKDDLGLMQNAYEMLIGVAYKATPMEMADVMLNNYYYFFQHNRKKEYLVKFYRDDSALNVEGLDGAFGSEGIANSILSSLENIKMEMHLEPFDIDSLPPARCAAYVKCNYMLKVGNDWPCKVLEIFELNFDDEYNLYIKKQLYVSRGARPLYVFSISLPPTYVRSTDPTFRDNRESMFVERENMAQHDIDAPFVPDTRTEEEKQAWRKVDIDEASVGSRSLNSASIKEDVEATPAVTSGWGWGSSAAAGEDERAKSKWGWSALSIGLGSNQHATGEGDNASLASRDSSNTGEVSAGKPKKGGWKLF